MAPSGIASTRTSATEQIYTGSGEAASGDPMEGQVSPKVQEGYPVVVPHFFLGQSQQQEEDQGQQWQPQQQPQRQQQQQQEQHQEAACRMENKRASKMMLENTSTKTVLNLRVEPDLLSKIPFIDDSDSEVNEAEDADQLSNFGLDEGDYVELQYPKTPPFKENEQFTFNIPKLHVDLPTNKAESESSDEVFAATRDKAPLNGGISITAAAMFEKMTSSVQRTRRSSDPSPRPSVDLTRDLRKVTSLPHAEEKTYSCVKAYRDAEREALKKIAKEYDIAVEPSDSVEGSVDDVAESTEKKSLLDSLTNRLKRSKSKKKKNKKSKKKQRKNKDRPISGFDDLLCNSGSYEDRGDSVPYYAREEEDSVYDFLQVRESAVPQGDYGVEAADEDEEDENPLTSKWKALKNSFRAISRPRVVQKRSLLLMQAPVAKGRLDYTKDAAARKAQYEEFSEVYPGLMDSSLKIEETVNTVEDVEQCLKRFFKKQAVNAIMAVIVFNGHGGKKGLVLSKDNPLPLDQFINTVSKVLEKHRRTSASVLPHMVKIVFAQCYGHLYTEPEERDIQIISFTSSKSKTTQATIKMDSLNREVRHSSHTQLRAHASHTSLVDDTFEQIRTRSRNVSGASSATLPFFREI